MPKALAGSPKPEIADDAYIFVRNTSDEVDANANWYLRINLPQKKQVVRALKVSYKPEDAANLKLAEHRGREIYNEIKERLDSGLQVWEMTIPILCKLFLAEGREKTALNEKLKEKNYEIIDGRGYWDSSFLNAIETHINKIILPYWDVASRKNIPVSKIRQTDIDKWRVWRKERFPEYAPSTIAKQNSTMRHLFKLALRKGENFIPPKITDDKKNIRTRRRPDISPEQHQRVMDHIRDGWEYAFRSGDIKPWHHYRFLLYCYLETLLYTGIRPWQTKANALRMDQIRKIEPDRSIGKEVQLHITRTAKQAEPYTVAAARPWISTLEALNRYYAGIGIGEDREYLIVHPESYGRKVRGQPVVSFKKQWHSIMKELDFNDYDNPDAPWYQRLNFYAYRHAYVGQQLRTNKDISPMRLARQLGTSLQMIDLIYDHFLVEREYEDIVGYDDTYVDFCRIFDDSGRQIDRVKTNSKEHFRYWEEGGEKRCAYPPEKNPPKRNRKNAKN